MQNENLKDNSTQTNISTLQESTTPQNLDWLYYRCSIPFSIVASVITLNIMNYTGFSTVSYLSLLTFCTFILSVFLAIAQHKINLKDNRCYEIMNFINSMVKDSRINFPYVPSLQCYMGMVFFILTLVLVGASCTVLHFMYIDNAIEISIDLLSKIVVFTLVSMGMQLMFLKNMRKDIQEAMAKPMDSNYTLFAKNYFATNWKLKEETQRGKRYASNYGNKEIFIPHLINFENYYQISQNIYGAIEEEIKYLTTLLTKEEQEMIEKVRTQK